MKIKSIIFDCDGVLVDTERDGHRVAFNAAFRQKGLDIEWGIDTYGELLKIGGGKERMRSFFAKMGYPEEIKDSERFIKELHEIKTALFMDIIRQGKLPLRTGVSRLIDEAIDHNVVVAVCSTSNEKAVNNIVDVMLGEKRKKKIHIFAGDMATHKKPDPEIYNLAIIKLNLKPSTCIVVEDSRNGLLAAKASGLKCIITRSHYTAKEDFKEADAVYNELGEDPEENITLEKLNAFI